MLQPKPLVTAIALAFSGLAVAQGKVPSTTLDEVVVHGSKLKSFEAGQSVSPQQLDALRPATSDTASLLRDVPGVSLYGAGGVSSLPVIHGLADDRLRIKVDGMDFIASCPNHMNPPLSYVDPTQVEAIKVYAGITPVSVGGDSIGGSVVVNTREPVFAQPGEGVLTSGEIGAFYRSNGDARGANVAASVATESFSLTYTGATAKSDNYKAAKDYRASTQSGRLGHEVALDEVGSSAYETYTHTLGMALRGGNHLFEMKLGYQDVPYQLFPNQRMDMLDNEQKRINLRYVGKKDWGKVEVRAFHEEVSHYMDFGKDKRYWYGADSNIVGNTVDGQPCAPISYTCAAGMPMYTKSKTDGVSLNTEILLGQRDTLRLGGEYLAYRLDDWWPPSGSGMFPGTFLNINNGERDRYALFGEWETQFAPQWTGLFGVRYEHVVMNTGDVQGYSTNPPPAPGSGGMTIGDATAFNLLNRKRSDNNWDLTALARYNANANTDVEFGFARKVRSPNLYERYTWSNWMMAAVMNNYVGDGNGYVGNPDLSPEKAHTVSASLDWHTLDRAGEFKVTPFFTHVVDYIDAVRVTNNVSNFNVLRYTNQTARLYGIDLSGRMPLGRTSLGAFGLKGVVNYTRGENRDMGDDLYNIMPLNMRLTLTHQSGNWDNAAELVAVKGKHDVSSVRNEIETSGYALLNLRSSYTWNKVRFDVGVDNVFDKFYYLPTGGAYTGQGRTMSMTGIPYGTQVPGMGRSLYAGVNVKF